MYFAAHSSHGSFLLSVIMATLGEEILPVDKWDIDGPRSSFTSESGHLWTTGHRVEGRWGPDYLIMAGPAAPHPIIQTCVIHQDH